MTLEQNIVLFIIVFILIFIVHLIINLIKVKRKKDVLGSSYVLKKFKIDLKKVNYKYLAFGISLINAFIISFVGVFITVLPLEIIWRLLIAFPMLFGMMYSLYEIMGRELIKKGWTKSEELKVNKKKGDK